MFFFYIKQHLLWKSFDFTNISFQEMWKMVQMEFNWKSIIFTFYKFYKSYKIVSKLFNVIEEDAKN